MKLVDLCVFLRPHHIAGQPSAVRTTTLESSKRNIAWEFGHLKKHVGTNLPLWNIKELRCDVGSSFSKKENSSKIYHIYYRKSTLELSIIEISSSTNWGRPSMNNVYNAKIKSGWRTNTLIITGTSWGKPSKFKKMVGIGQRQGWNIPIYFST